MTEPHAPRALKRVGGHVDTPRPPPSICVPHSHIAAHMLELAISPAVTLSSPRIPQVMARPGHLSGTQPLVLTPLVLPQGTLCRPVKKGHGPMRSDGGRRGGGRVSGRGLSAFITLTLVSLLCSVVNARSEIFSDTVTLEPGKYLSFSGVGPFELAYRLETSFPVAPAEGYFRALLLDNDNLESLKAGKEYEWIAAGSVGSPTKSVFQEYTTDRGDGTSYHLVVQHLGTECFDLRYVVHFAWRASWLEYLSMLSVFILVVGVVVEAFVWTGHQAATVARTAVDAVKPSHSLPDFAGADGGHSVEGKSVVGAVTRIRNRTQMRRELGADLTV